MVGMCQVTREQKQLQNTSSHHIMNSPNNTITSTGTTAFNPGLLSRASAPDVVSDFEAKTYLKAISVELKQLSFVTSSTSSGSAKVMSTHYGVSQYQSDVCGYIEGLLHTS